MPSNPQQSGHFNELTPAEAERLALLLEELGEAQQAIGKILRHGYGSRHPDGGPTNRESLVHEIGDVAYAVDLMVACGDLPEKGILLYKSRKAEKVVDYVHHQFPFVLKDIRVTTMMHYKSKESL